MKLLLALCLIFGLFTSSFANVSANIEETNQVAIVQNLEELQSWADMGNFLIGFAEGVEISLTGGYRSCVQSAGASINEFSASFRLIDSGLKRKNLGDTRAGIRDFGIGLIDVVKTYQKCGVGKLVSEIQSVSKEVSSETGIIILVLREAIDILHHSHSLLSEFKGAISDCGRGDWTGCGRNSGHIVGTLLHQ